MLASVAGQASLSLTWSETPEDTFSHDEAQMYLGKNRGISVWEIQTFVIDLDHDTIKTKRVNFHSLHVWFVAVAEITITFVLKSTFCWH